MGKGYVRVEFHLPGAEWILADPTAGNAGDPTGTYAYEFGDVPDANAYLAMDVGDQHLMMNTDFGGIQAPNWWWTGGATYNSYTAISYLQPNGVLSITNSAKGSFAFNLTDVPNEGSMVVQSSTNLTTWSSMVTNSASGTNVSYSFPKTNGIRRFYRVNVIP